MQQRTYLDHAASAPLRPEAVAAMTAELTRVGNPSSLHTSGRAARRVVEESREVIAAALGAAPSEVIFTSGATEADNLILKGAFRARSEPSRLLIPRSEHHAVLDSVESLTTEGAVPELLDVDRQGMVDAEQLAALLADRPETIAVVSIMWANNETGVVQPIREFAELARRSGVLFHTDAVQAAGAIPIDFAADGPDALSVTAHKLGGPVGVGALLARKELKLAPIQHGGGQERDLRSGTLDVAGIAGFAAAIAVARQQMSAETARLRALRSRLVDGVLGTQGATGIDGSSLNGSRSPEHSLPGIANVSFAGCQADNLLLLLDQAGIDSSAGSACTAGVSEPSHVLMAMGHSVEQARSSVRFSLGHTSTEADVDHLLRVLPEAVERARRAG
ncbi:cysteine desulfurase family protein [Microlunatus soli]|uniref:Cysteine desulfurase n=1 Tax=Microlunatus soli TaxID=630515 RepID=A0A1H2A191_9ACTN|nr:cysteine desulfurase family protein [Microlunatus soli]SDT39663.1 cysteine desulfurase [Microlunatus soli]